MSWTWLLLAWLLRKLGLAKRQDAATAACGELVDAGPYRSFEEATDALGQLEIIDERE